MTAAPTARSRSSSATKRATSIVGTSAAGAAMFANRRTRFFTAASRSVRSGWNWPRCTENGERRHEFYLR
jgi:hypothetical protein